MMHVHAHKVDYANMTFLQLSQLDPSQTAGIQRSFMTESDFRFNWLARVITRAIVEKDVFGLRDQVIELILPVDDVMKTVQTGMFDFPRSSQKVDGFMNWLDEMEQQSVLEVTRRPGAIRGVEEAWSDIYVRSSYVKGIGRGKRELRKANYNIPRLAPDPADEVRIAFNQPFHVDRVGLAYTRTFNDLKGVTREMDTQISRELAQGLAEGRGPLDIARSLTDRVEKIGRTRGRMVARTEVIRAHHSANIAEYKRAGVLGIKVMAEWETAGDPCPLCVDASLKSPYTIEEIEPLIPLHPNCRCVALPIPAELADKEIPDTVKGAHGFLPDCHDVLPMMLVAATAKHCVMPQDKERVKKAINSHKPCTAAVRRQAIKNERKLAKEITGAKHLPNNEPYDVYLGTKEVPNHMIEVKTIVRGKNNKITMHKESLERKIKLAKKHKGAKIHTVVFDDRVGDIYYREGVGSFRLDSMHKVKGMGELDDIIYKQRAFNTIEDAHGHLPSCEFVGLMTLTVMPCLTDIQVKNVTKELKKHHPTISDYQQKSWENVHKTVKSMGWDKASFSQTNKAADAVFGKWSAPTHMFDVKTLANKGKKLKSLAWTEKELLEKIKYAKKYPNAKWQTLFFDDATNKVYHSNAMDDLISIYKGGAVQPTPGMAFKLPISSMDEIDDLGKYLKGVTKGGPLPKIKIKPIPKPTITPKRPKLGSFDEVASNFKKKAHGDKYMEYKQEYLEWWEGKVGGNFNKTTVLNKVKSDINGPFHAVEAWHSTTKSTSSMALKYRASEMEKGLSKMVWNGTAGKDKIIGVMNKFIPEDQYLRMRAFNQAYLEKAGKRTITAYRGTDGGTGRQLSLDWANTYERAVESLRRGLPYSEAVYVDDASLAGYSYSRRVAENFGGSSGVAVRLKVPHTDVLWDRDLMSRITNRFSSEQELLILGRRRAVPFADVRLRGKGWAGLPDKPTVAPPKPKLKKVVKPKKTKVEKAIDKHGSSDDVGVMFKVTKKEKSQLMDWSKDWQDLEDSIQEGVPGKKYKKWSQTQYQKFNSEQNKITKEIDKIAKKYDSYVGEIMEEIERYAAGGHAPWDVGKKAKVGDITKKIIKKSKKLPKMHIKKIDKLEAEMDKLENIFLPSLTDVEAAGIEETLMELQMDYENLADQLAGEYPKADLSDYFTMML
jgi:hypothetical protein